ncbi:MAG: cell division protein FtsQ/DivIB [Bdellovibrionales bacterium]|nr:cell division protein FtsQ/DivIB [Bdellovibrionales bacterium]
MKICCPNSGRRRFFARLTSLSHSHITPHHPTSPHITPHHPPHLSPNHPQTITHPKKPAQRPTSISPQTTSPNQAKLSTMRFFPKLLRWPALIFTAIFVAAGTLIILNPTWIKVEDVRLELNPESHEDLLFQRIKSTLDPQFAKFKDKYFWEVPLTSVFEMTTKDKRVKKVSIYREFPSRLRVEIEPYTPVLAYLAGDGRIYPVATDATLLPALPPADAPDLPFLRGEDLKDEPGLRETALELYESIPEDGALNKKQISEISYSKKDGFKLFVSSATSEVRMGDTDFGPKISRVTKVLSYLDSQNIKGRVIDARFSKKVVVRVRNSP